MNGLKIDKKKKAKINQKDKICQISEIHVNDRETTDTNKKTDYQNALICSLKTNYIFYISCIICIYIISYYDNSQFLCNILSFISVSLIGYFTHLIAHHISFTKIYNNLDNYITQNRYLNAIFKRICTYADFHDIIHHDTDINKTPENLLYEFILNFFTQGGNLILLVLIARHINIYILFLWGLMYATIHIINYSFVRPLTHKYHHLDKYTNYGIDIWDIMFGTKYNNHIDDIENINHYSFNIFIITGLIVKIFLI